METAIPVFEQFDVDTNINSLSSRWEDYIDRYNDYCLAFDIKNPERKKALLLHSAGVGVKKMCIVKNLLKKQRSNINDALLAYRSAPLCNSKHSPAELMFNRQMKDNILTIPIHFKSQDLERINHSQDSKYKDLHSGDKSVYF